MMVAEALSSATSGSTTEIIGQLIDCIFELVTCASDVLVKKDSFKELAAYLERIVPILKELRNKKVSDIETFNRTIDILNREINEAKKLIQECSKRNKVYLLLNCRSISKRLKNSTSEISRALALIPLATQDLSFGIVEEIENLCDNMQKAEFKAAIAEEQILDKIESGINEKNMDRSYANNLLILIAQAVGITNEKSTMKKELEEFKSEVENARLRKDLAEAIQMDQIIALLERADAATSPREKELKYFAKRKSLGSQPLDPLQSFYCPITREVMVDPVETSSGQTFERSAIEKWFADGNNMCPLTMTPLDTSVLRPNKTLKQSIEEWKDRNTMISIASMKEKIESGEDEEVLRCLGTLKGLCEEKDQHREWVVMENYIPVLILVLGSRNRDVRHEALVILLMLAKDSDDAKERLANVDNAIESIVRTLGRRVTERKLAAALLLELSKHDRLREHIGKVQGCILLLVTISSSDDNQAGRDAAELLENLSYSDENVLLMAKANYFKHLLQRLSSGPDNAKLLMATTLAEMELTDHNKESLFAGGVLDPLLHLISDGDLKVKTMAIRALRNLSSLKKNGLEMIRQGAVHPLFRLLFQRSLPPSSLAEHVAAIIMQLAESTIGQDTQAPVLLFESDGDVFNLFSLIRFSGPEVKRNIIQTFYALCQSTLASYIKTKLVEREGISPDDVTFVGLLMACIHGGLVEKGRQIFNAMTNDFRITPKLEHYGCMVDLLGRAGKLREAHETILSMPMQPDSIIWGALLGACSFHGNVEVAEKAAESLFALEPDNPGNYVILSNIYASTGQWDGVAKLRKVMKGGQITKAAGYSLIEEGDQLHKFIVEDRSHSKSEEIFALLDGVYRIIRLQRSTFEFHSVLDLNHYS